MLYSNRQSDRPELSYIARVQDLFKFQALYDYWCNAARWHFVDIILFDTDRNSTCIWPFNLMQAKIFIIREPFLIYILLIAISFPLIMKWVMLEWHILRKFVSTLLISFENLLHALINSYIFLHDVEKLELNLLFSPTSE